MMCEIIHNMTPAGQMMNGAEVQAAYEPTRISTAISCQFLSQVSGELKHFAHLQTICEELFSFIYKDFKEGGGADGGAEGSEKDLRGFMHGMPFFELARSLRVHVTRLEEERKELEAEEAQLVVRRQVRKRVVRRLISERQRQLMLVFFGQWKTTVEKIHEKRMELMKWFRKLTEIKVADVFKAWHAWMIKEQLERAKREKSEYEWMMGTLGEELTDAKTKESKLEKELDFCTTEKVRLEKELEDTLAAIHAQKVPETMEVIANMGQALSYIGTTAMGNIEPILKDVEDAPCFQKIAKIYWSQKEEDDNKEAETKKIQEEAKLREEREVKRKKREEREKKLQAKEAKLAEKEAEAAAAKAKVVGEEEYKEKIEESEGELKFKREDMDAAGVRAAKKAADEVRKYYADRQKERAKKVADDLAEKIRLYKIEQAENEIRWHKERKENDPDHTDEEVAEALKKLTHELPEDVVLQLWVKYHLRRATRGGFGYRRKVYNYKDDLRDGVSYGVLMKRIGAHVIEEADGNMDEEIDPQVRIDTMMEQSGRLEPPATAFNTRGHILGQDTMLNAAFLSRLMITHSGCKMEQAEDAEIFKLREKFEDIKKRWEQARATISKFSQWDSWVQLRDSKTDEQLDEILASIEQIAVDLTQLREDLKPLQALAIRGQQAWWPIHNRMQQWSWKLFGVKVKQEEEAPPGVDIDTSKNHAPFKLKDIRFEKKFVQFTELQKGRMRDLLNYTKFFDDFKEAEVLKKKEVAEKCREENRQMEEGEDELTEEEVEAIRNSVVPISDENLDDVHAGLEKIFRKHYFDLSRIFKYYAAGGEGGAATDVSLAEWWQMSNDCQYPGGKDPNNIEKQDVERCFNETETEEEIEKREKKKARRNSAAAKADAELGPDEADQIESESEDEEEQKEKTEEEEYYEDEYDWDLGEGEREIGPEAWIEGIVRIACYKFRKVEDVTERLEKLIEEFMIPNACKSNTDTFRGELSLDEVQSVYKKLKPQIMKIFRFYARVHEPIPGAPPQEPSMDGPAYMKFCKDSRLVTRKGDLRHDFPELSCRKVFNDTQMEEEEEGSIDAGGGADEMIYMEYLEALGAIACFKFPNPYIPLQIKLEDMLKNICFPNQEKFALKKAKGRAKGKKKK